MARCPHCGRNVSVELVAFPPPPADFVALQRYESRQPWRRPGAPWEQWGDFFEARSVPAGVAEYSREQATRPATIESDVWVPALQSTLTGLAASIPTAAATVAFGWPWYIPLVAGGGAMCMAWGYLLADHRKLLRKIERIVNRDFDGDGRVGEPGPVEQRPTTIEIVTVNERGNVRGMQFVGLPAGVTEADFIAFCQATIEGAPMTQGRWTGGGNPWGRAQFDALMDVLDRAGYVRWRSPGSTAQGRELTAKGRAIFREAARASTRERIAG